MAREQVVGGNEHYYGFFRAHDANIGLRELPQEVVPVASVRNTELAPVLVVDKLEAPKSLFGRGVRFLMRRIEPKVRDFFVSKDHSSY